jgi:hypothetical protein
MPFSVLEKNILKAKGLSDDLVEALSVAGIEGREDFKTVGSAKTLTELLPGIDPAVAGAVMAWAVGETPRAETGGTVVVETADVVNCIHCKTKQPKDYKSGDLCPACGKQAEPILSCFWCAASGPGKFCRQCGAEFVPTAEVDLAILLRRDGLPKDDVPKKLRAMSADEKDLLWGRVRKSRG